MGNGVVAVDAFLLRAVFIGEAVVHGIRGAATPAGFDNLGDGAGGTFSFHAIDQICAGLKAGGKEEDAKTDGHFCKERSSFLFHVSSPKGILRGRERRLSGN